MKKPICSIKHFNRLIKKFKKNVYLNFSIKFIEDESKLDVIMSNAFGRYDELNSNDFNYYTEALLETFKRNPFKTHSCFKFDVDHVDSKMWVSYTVEDVNKKRVKDITNNCFLVFKIYVKTENYRKKRVYRWSVPMTWHKL